MCAACDRKRMICQSPRRKGVKTQTQLSKVRRCVLSLREAAVGTGSLVETIRRCQPHVHRISSIAAQPFRRNKNILALVLVVAFHDLDNRCFDPSEFLQLL